MAYAALVSVSQSIEKIIQNPDEYSLSLHHQKAILSLDKHIILLQQFLEDFPDKAKAHSLEGRISDVANEAENMIEFYMLEKTQLHSNRRSSRASFAGSKFRRQLMKIRNRIDSITGEIMTMKDTTKDGVAQVPRGGSVAASSSSIRIAEAGRTGDEVGLHDDLISIKLRLCELPSGLQIISIVGMGGIGKTTLARNAYDDPLSKQHFDVRAWVTVSQDYSVRELLSSLLVSLKLNDEEIPQKGELIQVKVHKSLKGRRYLIVMDDMWSRDAWDSLRSSFPDDSNGSRVILTTRLYEVAEYPDSLSQCHEMRLMDANQSWDLLKMKVFKNQDCPSELEHIGEKIAKQCKGLPLAIVAIGGLLSTISRDPASWADIARKVNAVVGAKDGQFEEILSLSYTHLPHHLRPCFLYMGGFREDREIRARFLVRLWVAEGFLIAEDESKSLEDVAEEYLEDLVQRSLVSICGRYSNGKIRSCKLHDLVRDLCIRKSCEVRFLSNHGGVREYFSSVTRLRRKPRSKCFGSTILHAITSAKSSRPPQPQSLRPRRVMIFEYIYGDLPSQMFEFCHVRLLAINYPNRISAAITNLQNLETLIIVDRDSIFQEGDTQSFAVTLPQEIWRMRRLRHVVHFGRLPEPEGGADLTLGNLQTLYSLASFMCTERILKMVPNVKKIKILCYQYGTYISNLAQWLHQLENLALRSASKFRAWRIEDEFYLPTGLTKLSLSYLRLPWSEMEMVGSLPNLQVLKLKHFACEGETWETAEGGFPALEILLIKESDVEELITESSHFPRLKWLELHDCEQLSEIPEDIGEIPTLEMIELRGRWKESLGESARSIQEEQKSYGNDMLQIRFSSSPKRGIWGHNKKRDWLTQFSPLFFALPPI